MRHYFKFTPAKTFALLLALVALGVTYNVFGPDQAKAIGVVITMVAAMFSDPPAPSQPTQAPPATPENQP